MFCKNCGKKLSDEAKFCTYCGAKITSEGEAAADGAQDISRLNDRLGETGQSRYNQAAPGEPILAGNGRRRGKGLIIGVVAAAVVVCAGVGVALSGILGGNPQAKVEKAFAKSMSAYAEMVKDMGLTTLTQLQEKQAYSTDVSVTLKELPAEVYRYYYDAGILEGLGMRVGTDYNLKDRAMSISAAISYGAADLVQATASLEDTVLTVYAPDFLGDSALGIDTMTLGADLSKLDPYNADDYQNISFNLYDFLDKYTQTPEVDPAAVKALREAVEVEETGKESVEVNGTDVDCTGYSVLIPEDAMRDYVDAVEDAVNALELDNAMMDLMESMGVPQDELQYMKEDIENAVSGQEIFDAVKEGLGEIGDVELQVYLKDGYVMAVEWEPRIAGSQMEVGLYLGGGKTYEDQWSLVISNGGEEVLVESEGDHTASSGRYTDATTISFRSGGSTSVVLESEMEYEPKADSDNFYWGIQGDGFAVIAEGQLTNSSDGLTLSLDNLEFRDNQETMLALEADYSVRPYEKWDSGAGAVKMIADMSSSDLENLGWEIQNNAQNWVYDLMEQIPALQDLMWYM